jgi:uncharacterized cupin superfamily protein
MPYIIQPDKLEFVQGEAPLDLFNWHTAVPRLSEMVKSKNLIFDIRSLDPGKYSYPYHFHRYSEELFVLISGSAMLRTPMGLQEIRQGEIIFFETDESGAHQLHNHTDNPCVYLDIRTYSGHDVTEYPDSEKINIAPNHGIFEKQSKVDYFKGEEKVEEIWKHLRSK